MAAAMVFCVSCGNKLAGRYCGQCGGDSQSTADAQSEVPVLTVPAGGAKKKERFSKTSQSQKVGKCAARDASKRIISAYLCNLGLDYCENLVHLVRYLQPSLATTSSCLV